MDVIEQHQRSPVPPLRGVRSGVPVALESLVMRLMSKVPADRPASTGVVRADLRRLRDALAAREPDRKPTALAMMPASEPPPPGPLDGGDTTSISISDARPLARTESVPALQVAETRPAPAVVVPVTERSPPVRTARPLRWIAGSAVLAVALGAAIALWPAPAPVEMPAPAPAPPLPTAVPEAPAAPTREALQARIEKLRAKRVTRSAAELLKLYGQELAAAKTDAQLREVEANLDDWEKQY
jgi:serine/threonine-protein kinase